LMVVDSLAHRSHYYTRRIQEHHHVWVLVRGEHNVVIALVRRDAVALTPLRETAVLADHSDPVPRLRPARDHVVHKTENVLVLDVGDLGPLLFVVQPPLHLI